MKTNKTTATDADVESYLASILPEAKQADARALDRLFRDVAGFEPVMWGASIVGYGRYHYVYDSGREGEFLATGFSARARYLSVYIMPGYADFGDILSRLGKHRKGKSCLNIHRMEDIDPVVLTELIRAGLADLAKRWDIHPT